MQTTTFDPLNPARRSTQDGLPRLTDSKKREVFSRISHVLADAPNIVLQLTSSNDSEQLAGLCALESFALRNNESWSEEDFETVVRFLSSTTGQPDSPFSVLTKSSELVSKLLRLKAKPGNSKAVDVPEECCPICLDGFKGKACFTTECGHIFHFSCIKAAVEAGNGSCALCRKSFKEMTAPARLRSPTTAQQAANANRAGRGTPTSLPRIDNWSLDRHNKVIKGHVYNYPGKRDGEGISTSPITQVSGRIVTTYSGNRYMLGNVHPTFLSSLPRYTEQDPLAGVELGH